MKNEDRVDDQCHICQQQLKGIAVSSDSESKVHSYRELLGYICRSCESVSCEKCKKDAFGYRFFSGFTKSVCSKCGQPEHNPLTVLSDSLDKKRMRSDNETRREFRRNRAASREGSNGMEIPNALIGTAASIIFLLVGGLPITEGANAIFQWLDDGGFIVVLGAMALGFFAPKFMGR
ncbi:MAG: hypothetical protein JAY90_22035 [Candidatus Thiodiazotropha lotti]|nr:hypothetical protein [Candidatus Thiodiazotropha lotti]